MFLQSFKKYQSISHLSSVSVTLYSAITTSCNDGVCTPGQGIGWTGMSDHSTLWVR